MEKIDISDIEKIQIILRLMTLDRALLSAQTSRY